MIATGYAVTFMPKLAVRATDTNLTYVPFAAPIPSRQIGLYYRKTSARAPLFLALATTISAAYL